MNVKPGDKESNHKTLITSTYKESSKRNYMFYTWACHKINYIEVNNSERMESLQEYWDITTPGMCTGGAAV